MKPSPQTTINEILLLRLAGTRWSASLERQLRQLTPGGVLLAGPLPPSPEALCHLLSHIAKTRPAPSILAIEEEGGAASPISALLPPLPSPYALGQKGPRSARLAGELIGEALKLLGFNANFAPTLDVVPEHTEKASSLCAFSDDPRVVTNCGHFFIEGLERHKILACAKHFPGLASVTPATGEELPVSGRSMAELWRSDLVPYRELLPRIPLIRMSTAAYKAYDFDYPRSAVLSTQVVQGLLRTKLSYRGVVVAPQLEFEPVRGVLDLGRAAAQSLRAGCDMLLVERAESWQPMRQGIEQALESGQLPRERWAQTLARISAVKQGLTPPPDRLSRTEWDRLARRFDEFG